MFPVVFKPHSLSNLQAGETVTTSRNTDISRYLNDGILLNAERAFPDVGADGDYHRRC